jgi:hypothetical protein
MREIRAFGAARGPRGVMDKMDKKRRASSRLENALRFFT